MVFSARFYACKHYVFANLGHYSFIRRPISARTVSRRITTCTDSRVEADSTTGYCQLSAVDETEVYGVLCRKWELHAVLRTGFWGVVHFKVLLWR